MPEDPIDALRTDPDLRPLIDEHGPVTIEPAEDTFRRLVVSVINQQLSSASAAAIRDRVFDRFEITPEALLAAREDELRETGLSRGKIEYVKNIAEAYTEKGYGHAYFEAMDDEAVMDELTDIKGIGTWTAKMYLMSCLGREDVFPVEDLGIRKGMWALYGDELDREGMYEAAEKWRPYRSYASRYLWRAYDG